MSPLKEVQTNNKILDFVIWAHKAGILSVVITCTICWILLRWVEDGREQDRLAMQKAAADYRTCTNNQIYLLTNTIEAATLANKDATQAIKENSETNRKMLEFLEQRRN